MTDVMELGIRGEDVSDKPRVELYLEHGHEGLMYLRAYCPGSTSNGGNCLLTFHSDGKITAPDSVNERYPFNKDEHGALRIEED